MPSLPFFFEKQVPSLLAHTEMEEMNIIQRKGIRERVEFGLGLGLDGPYIYTVHR
jgi:hypothetical protein